MKMGNKKYRLSNKDLEWSPYAQALYAQLSHTHPTNTKLVVDALGDDIDNIKVSTFANLIDLYERSNTRQQHNAAQLTEAQQQVFDAMTSNYPELDPFDLSKSTPSNNVCPSELVAISVRDMSDLTNPVMKIQTDDVLTSIDDHNTNVIDLADSLSDRGVIIIARVKNGDQYNLHEPIFIYKYQGNLKFQNRGQTMML